MNIINGSYLFLSIVDLRNNLIFKISSILNKYHCFYRLQDENINQQSSEVIPVTSFPQAFAKLLLTDSILKTNSSSSSFHNACKMFEFGNSYIVNGPSVNGREIVWKVQSQQNESQSYDIVFSANLLTTHKSIREKHKNFNYKCTCPDFKVIVSQIYIFKVIFHLMFSSKC